MSVFEGWKVTSPYKYRSDPFTGSQVFHTGIDLVKYHKYPIPAFVGGVVLFSGDGGPGTGFGGYGNVVALRDDAGYVHCYCHLDSVAAQKGQTISKGDIVGYQGTTGRSTGSHLHYEVRSKDSPSYGYGSHVDPGEYLEAYLKEEEPVLDTGVANTVIDTWMSPAWKELDAKRQDAEKAGDITTAAAHQQQADYIHWLANELRKASGQVLQ
ncbi:M23 family metallopeptidase [Paenibacillus oleatilyticus]|uniref:M23 family metallopeptidase n=1 Tax=Paenibacillus oleatilyticus TaxID=2594886 RepID=A0ABV4UVA1_9BACL